ncbi:hypothetical protein GPECTOR_7g1247 [Gonium pectorale]|uniref:EF-hand domain-containing protein n=1 Tax=Gonium pectorale TaxID=33097 RepID=A0A150GUD3_GONPE|nr:hypothetical protein GPECTOR_7g1247 [Gonium pectorale]|eukprot:KXZ53352.1 hypothetical protein GPECTOR_7g1247 [Gonium pectorale]
MKASVAIKVVDVLKKAGSGRRQKAGLDQLMAELDKNRDGDVDAEELINLLEGVVEHRRQRKWMWFVIIALSAFALATIAATVGLTYAVLEAMKDTEIHNGIMYVKGSETELVRTGSAEFSVVNGIMVSRSLLNTTTTPVNGTTTAGRRVLASTTSTPAADLPPPQSVLRTAIFKGTPQRFSSRVSVQVLLELEYLYIVGAGAVELGVKVDGVARVPDPSSKLGTVIRIITPAGTYVGDLDDERHWAADV